MGAQTYINSMMMNPYMQAYPTQAYPTQAYSTQAQMNYYPTPPVQYYQPIPNYGYMDPNKTQYYNNNNNNMNYYPKGQGPKK